MRHHRVVYFLLSGDAIKIGCTQNLERRLADIGKQIDAKPSLIGWVLGNFQTETLIHKHLSAYAEGNEWFRDCPEVRNLIAYLLAKGPRFQGLPVKR